MKKYNRILSLVILISCVFGAACNEAKPKTEVIQMRKPSTDSAMKFTVAMVDNKKDPSCGMPVTAGIADTVHYEGKILGFCSVECKEQFLKNPKELVKNAELK